MVWKEILVWDMDDATMEWNGRFQKWNGRQSSILDFAHGIYKKTYACSDN